VPWLLLVECRGNLGDLEKESKGNNDMGEEETETTVLQKRNGTTCAWTRACVQKRNVEGTKEEM